MGWGDKYLDAIEFRTVKEINSRVLGLMKGDFHGADGYMPQDQIKRLMKTDEVNVFEEESMRIFYFIIHNGRSPMNDINFRKALSYSFDYTGFIKDILSDSVARNPVPLPNNIWGAPQGVKGYTYDLDKAREHLAKVKEPLREITIGALAGYGQTEQAAVLLQSALSKIGVKSKILSDTWPVASGKMRNEQQMYDLLPLWKSTYYADPNNWVGEMYYGPNIGSRNNSWYQDDQVDQWITEAIGSTDQAVRAANYAKAEMVTAVFSNGLREILTRPVFIKELISNTELRTFAGRNRPNFRSQFALRSGLWCLTSRAHLAEIRRHRGLVRLRNYSLFIK